MLQLQRNTAAGLMKEDRIATMKAVLDYFYFFGFFFFFSLTKNLTKLEGFEGFCFISEDIHEKRVSVCSVALSLGNPFREVTHGFQGQERSKFFRKVV